MSSIKRYGFCEMFDRATGKQTLCNIIDSASVPNVAALDADEVANLLYGNDAYKEHGYMRVTYFAVGKGGMSRLVFNELKPGEAYLGNGRLITVNNTRISVTKYNTFDGFRFKVYDTLLREIRDTIDLPHTPSVRDYLKLAMGNPIAVYFISLEFDLVSATHVTPGCYLSTIDGMDVSTNYCYTRLDELYEPRGCRIVVCKTDEKMLHIDVNCTPCV